jgi:hypothetical protein
MSASLTGAVMEFRHFPKKHQKYYKKIGKLRRK